MSETAVVTPGLAEPVEPWQKALYSFLQEVPALGSANSEIKSGTPSLPRPNTEAEVKAKEFTTDPRFRKYTGWEHKSLLLKWVSDGTTTCNEFCQKCALNSGYTGDIGIGRFDLLDQLINRGLGHVWVHADSGAQPEFGDIFRLLGDVPDDNGIRLNHMAVSLYIEGSTWYTVEGGQGGRRLGYDAIKRKIRPWPQPYLKGWVSMRALIAETQPVPYWLGGWWEVEEEPYDTYWYYFSAGGKVSCCYSKPVSFLSPPLSANLQGVMTLKGMYECDVVWQSQDGKESLKLSVQRQAKRDYQMEGRTARGVKLNLKKQMTKDPFG